MAILGTVSSSVLLVMPMALWLPLIREVAGIPFRARLDSDAIENFLGFRVLNQNRVTNKTFHARPTRCSAEPINIASVRFVFRQIVLMHFGIQKMARFRLSLDSLAH
jgi:hypothetical protein